MEKNNKPLNVPHLRFPEFSGEWESKRLDECVTFLDEQRKPIKSTERSSESKLYPYYGASGVIDYIDDYIFDEELILLSEDGANILDRNYRVAFIIKGKTWVNNHAHVLKPMKNVDISYLSEYLESLKYEKYNTGSTMPKLNQEVCRSIRVWMPQYEEQSKIGRLLSVINERIETQKKIIEDLKKLKDAINNSLHNYINAFQLFSFNELGNDYSGLTGKSSEDFGSGLPYISYLNVLRNDIVTNGQFDCVKVSKTEKQNVVSYGDLLFTLSSETPSEVGIGSVYLGKTNPIYLNSFCFGVHLSNQGNIYGPYLAYFVTSQYFRKTILPFAQGSTRYNLMKSDFMKHKFRFPNMATQKAIYNTLHTLSEKIQNEEVCLNKYTEQKQYLLARLFI